jgi:phosphoribosylformimino-5-aminoimidazole carboxamide ribotide isomerase
MIVFPVIELQNGHCVTLHKGRVEEPVVWHVDPVKRALDYVDQGAEWLHVTDIDAITQSGSNEALIRDIILHAETPVQVAGGLRTLERVSHWIDAGAAHVVIGTAAVRDPAIVRRAAEANPDQIVLAVDAWRGKVICEGWREETLFDPIAFAHSFDGVPLAAILFTDIDRDIDHADPALAVTARLATSTRTPVISRGLVKSLADISRLKYSANIHGAMIGEALLRKNIDLAEAIHTARKEPEPVAKFI